MRTQVLLAWLAVGARAPLSLTSTFGAGQDIPPDNRGSDDADNISPPLSWAGVPKNTESFVLIVDGESDKSPGARTHWIVYDIPKDVTEMREELSGAGASSVSRLGMKEDAGQAPVVCCVPFRLRSS
jgi:phosphatidylethanolamine-binding protein (PEBP) family uncharacterized protein